MKATFTIDGFDVEIADTVPDCLRCGTECLLAIWVPHGWRLATGAQLRGRGRILLCSVCGSDDPYGAALITFFHVHGQVSDSTLKEFIRLAGRWAGSVPLPRVAQAAFEDDVAAWRRGDFD